MNKILLSGCNGKMGHVVSKLAEASGDSHAIAAGYDINISTEYKYPVYTNLIECKEKVNSIIDFSNPEALESILKYAILNKIPLVLATTGLSQNHKKLVEEASFTIPVFVSANMSIGVNLLIALVKKAAKTLHETFDIEIVEKHHNQKIDAPSGTALAIADEINKTLQNSQEYVFDRHSRRKKRSGNEIGIHAVRGGTIVGEHAVIFAGNDEIIEIKHTAMSKDIFAAGALKASTFIIGKKPGIYSMTDMIGEY